MMRSTPRGPSPDEAWQTRSPITAQERLAFAQEVERQRTEARKLLGIDDNVEPTPLEADELERRAIGSALEALGYLTKSEVKRPPRKAKRWKRQSLERALRQQREQRQESVTALERSAGNTQLQSSPPPSMLDTPPDAATMQAVADTSSTSAGIRPQTGATQRECALFTWWRRPITLLFMIAKAAKIMR